MTSRPQALIFDVFGTCVDWRSSLTREGEALGNRLGISGIDWAALADTWRAQYQPSMEPIRTGKRAWVTLDRLHRESLDVVLPMYGLDGISAAERDSFAHAWRRLDPWPDVAAGLARLHQEFILAPNSNGNIALMVAMARRNGFPWDAILGAEIAHAYKPQAEVYLASAAALDLAPSMVMMVAAHNNDLRAAKMAGLQTAFVPRTTEHGPGQTTDLEADASADLAVQDFSELADRLGA